MTGRGAWLLATGMTLLAGFSCRRPESQAPQLTATQDAAPVRVATAVASGRMVATTMALTGTLLADQQSDVAPLVSGRVEQVFVERGARVHMGDPLLRLRDADFRSSAETARAALGQAIARLGEGARNPEEMAEVRAARANLDVAEDGLRRTQQLAAQGAVSQQDLLRAQSQADAARAQFNSALNGAHAAQAAARGARASVTQTARAVSDSVVRAPFDGEVAERRVNVGEFILNQRAAVLLVRTNPLRIELPVPQDSVRFVREGQSVELRVDAFPEERFTGTIRYISAAVRTDSRALIAEAVVPNPGPTPDSSGRLRPGMFATARVDLGQQRQVTVVPGNAVLTEAGVSRCFVVANGRVEERIVTVVDRSGTEVLLDSGVAAGDHVATERLDRLADGVRVAQ